MLIVLKFVSWSISLGSGTSGGTLAPLFTIGGGLGALLGARGRCARARRSASTRTSPRSSAWRRSSPARRARCSRRSCSRSRRRASRWGCLPLLAGCSAAYLVSLLLMRSSIMTEKLARRGTPVRTEYSADFLDRVSVADAATREVVTLNENTALTDVIDWLSTRGIGTNHQGFPVLDDDGIARRRRHAARSARSQRRRDVSGATR